MAPNKWDDEEEDSTPPSSPPPVVTRRGKFDDEEEDSDVADAWDAEDSEEEREKAKKAEAAKAKEEAEKKANHKTPAQRRQEHIERRKKEAEEEDDSDEEEDEEERKARVLREQKQADLSHAEDLFGEIGISNNRGAAKHVTVSDPNDPANLIDLTTLTVFNPKTKDQFTRLRETLTPLISQNSKAAHYSLFLQEFVKQISKELPSDQIKKVASGLTTLSNEKLKEEKAAEKGGKKSKAAKTKVTLNASRDISYKADTAAYDDGLEDDDFM